MPEAKFIIPTRQKTDVLADTSDPLGAGASVDIDAFKVAGYASTTILAFSDQPFQIRIEEGCSCDGRFVTTHTFTSEPSGGNQVLCVRVEPCGPFMRATVTNLGGAQSFFQLCWRGLPVP